MATISNSTMERKLTAVSRRFGNVFVTIC